MIYTVEYSDLCKSIYEDRMGAINPKLALKDKPDAWQRAIERLPYLLQQEILDERPDPDEEDLNFINSWMVDEKPVAIDIRSLLGIRENLASISRTPPEVIGIVNAKWGLNVRPGKVYDQNPGRYLEYARKFSAATAKPSVMVDGEIYFGVGRFIAALLRGDQKMLVWDVKTR